MTNEEAIKVLEKQFDKSCGNYHYQNAEKLDFEDALWVAISALRQQERFGDVNKALTLDELRQMDGEPVWWWNKSAKPVCTICVWDRFMDEPMFANYDWQSEYTLQLSKYKWLKKCGYKPYRQKPEEDDHA